ncbi:MAG: hypothetical protein GEU75_06915 [Dehalococcoidia bacterium]|nr:hypothetical protein [Dehalococcoidia bacterium]
MSLDARLNKLMPALSARERAVLVLRSMKDKTPEDPSWRRSMPSSQTHEFNRYIELMNGCNHRLAFLILHVCKEVEKLELRIAWLSTLRLWELNLAELDLYASVLTREAVTAGEHERLQKKAEQEYIGISEAAKALAEAGRAWTEDDLERLGPLSQQFVKDSAWQRLCAAAEAKLRQAVAAGELVGRGAGQRLALRRGSLDAWLGRPVTVRSEWAGGYEVRPDGQWAAVMAEKVSLGHLREALDTMPGARSRPELEASSVSQFIEKVEALIRGGAMARWQDLRAVERALDQVAEEFGGEDPLKPLLRQDIEEAKQTLRHVAECLAVYDAPAELAEPDEHEVSETLTLIEGRPLQGSGA